MEQTSKNKESLRKNEPEPYPAIWDEACLRRAIKDFHTLEMAPEQRAYFARIMSANAEAVKAEKQKIREAEECREKVVETEMVKNALLNGLDVNLAANIANVSIDFVTEIQRVLADQW